MGNPTGMVNRIIPFSNVDGPGNRLAIFFQGCNVQCVYCHNPETIHRCVHCGECVAGCPEEAISMSKDELGRGKVLYNIKKCTECDQCIRVCRFSASPRTQNLIVDEILEEILEYKEYIRGITVSGGEPTLQAPFITELFKQVRLLGLTCFVDTNGFFDMDSPEIKELIMETDKFMVDIKAEADTKDLCGVNLEGKHIENLKKLLSLDKVYEVRTVLIHNFMDMEKTVEGVSNILKEYPSVHYKIIRVHPAGLHEEIRNKIKKNIPSEEEVKLLAEKAKLLGVKTVETIL